MEGDAMAGIGSNLGLMVAGIALAAIIVAAGILYFVKSYRPQRPAHLGPKNDDLVASMENRSAQHHTKT
jgi:hypothetical protein